MATLPDNRFVLPPTLIDFTNDVGETGQQHDIFPAGGQQARYDWMRMALIALLANQASHNEPINFRAGSLWFDLHEEFMKIRTGAGVAGTDWSSLTDVIQVGSTTLTQWLADAGSLLVNVKPASSYSGHAASTTSQIPIPSSLQADISDDVKAMVWVNGILRDPRETPINSGCPSYIQLSEALNEEDRFTVYLTRIDDEHFIPGDVIAG